MGNGEIIGVNEQAINAEKTLESRLTALRLDVLKGIKQLTETFGENRTGLGAHTGSIEALLTDLGDFAVGTACDPIKKLEKRLSRSNKLRRAIMENDVYGKKH